ncbi:hypothetical protein RISK_006825 [Rhodopirellula islandica]|uniref:Uncharacterized protein n=1 Tax=Rhodopirellula islandica TaxID=595434 RepID=A0A0J1B437_RHOIS|nr:hypothetical protein RISK_006825 [Rhodopirellula islandica]
MFADASSRAEIPPEPAGRSNLRLAFLSLLHPLSTLFAP